jgi:hypothetical protein
VIGAAVVVGALLIGLGVVVPALHADSYDAPLSEYLDHLRKNEPDAAYAMLCGLTKRILPPDGFKKALDRQREQIGPIKSMRRLEGKGNLGSTRIEGEVKTVVAITRMSKSEGKWKPCPVSSPFGSLEAPS